MKNILTAIFAMFAAAQTANAQTVNFVSKYVTSSTFGDSQIFDNGTRIGIGTLIPLSLLDLTKDVVWQYYNHTIVELAACPNFLGIKVGRMSYRKQN